MAQKFGIEPRDIINFVLRTQYFDTMESIGKSGNTKVLFMGSDMKKEENFISMGEAIINPEPKKQNKI